VNIGCLNGLLRELLEICSAWVEENESTREGNWCREHMWDFGCFNPNHDCTNLSASKQGFGKHPVHLGLRPSPCNGSSAVVNSPMNYLMNTCNIPIIPIRHSYNAKKFSLQIHITFSDIWLLDPKASDSHFAGQTPMLVGKK
jgi:hypothetical protein